MKIVTSVETMRYSDAETIRGGVNSKELMYRAGEGLFRAYPWQGKTAIVCGSGNNAGDGYVLALLLQKHGIDCTLFLLSDRFSADGAYYYEQCKQAGIPSVNYTASVDFSQYREIVDCILGTGFSGDVKGIYADVIKKINASDCHVVSADINSGLDGENGQGALAVQSDLTVSFGFYQYGHFLGFAKDLMKEKTNVDIGINLHGEHASLVEADDFADILKPRRQASHKGSYGYVALMGGCREYSGAAKLANMSCAALRSGCGVATLAVPNAIADSVAPYLLESTLAPMPDQNGRMIADLDAIDRLLSKKSALGIGMGWGQSDAYASILTHILKNHELSLVIDADGLNTLAKMDQTALKNTKCHVLLTPHLMEFSRLSGYGIKEIEADPIGLAKQYAAEKHVNLLLKGACTVVTDGNEVLLVDRGCAGMATAGSGDVLSGILTGLVGYNTLTPKVAACGAYIAGLAGELAEQAENAISMVASDTVRHISKAISMMINGKE